MDPRRDPKAFTSNFALDYYRRPRKLRSAKWWLSLIAAAVSAGAVAAFVIDRDRHTAFQAAPVSHVHSSFGNDCAKCHDTTFATARRFLPGSGAHSVSDAKCLECHDAGRHNPNDNFHGAAVGQAAGCTDCHHEHRGDRLSRLPDSACTECHGRLPVGANVYASIHHFATDHPEFGAWRKPPLHDPAGGAFRFNHARHLGLKYELNAVPPERQQLVESELRKMELLGCSYCHQSTADGRSIKPIRYLDHCAACHPLTVPEAPQEWPPNLREEMRQTRLPHPGPGQTAAVVRGALMSRYRQLGDEAELTPATKPVEPAILRSEDEQAAAARREKLAFARTLNAERHLFDTAGAGCSECHVESSTRAKGSGELPAYAAPRQQTGRWAGQFQDWPFPRLKGDPSAANPFAYADDRNRWFPLSVFDHHAHRTMTCTECHGDAVTSTATGDVLMPKRDSCVVCHNQSSTAARSDCLSCHRYHDRSQERSAEQKKKAREGKSS